MLQLQAFYSPDFLYLSPLPNGSTRSLYPHTRRGANYGTAALQRISLPEGRDGRRASCRLPGPALGQSFTTLGKTHSQKLSGVGGERHHYNLTPASPSKKKKKKKKPQPGGCINANTQLAAQAEAETAGRSQRQPRKRATRRQTPEYRNSKSRPRRAPRPSPSAPGGAGPGRGRFKTPSTGKRLGESSASHATGYGNSRRCPQLPHRYPIHI